MFFLAAFSWCCQDRMNYPFLLGRVRTMVVTQVKLFSGTSFALPKCEIQAHTPIMFFSQLFGKGISRCFGYAWKTYRPERPISSLTPLGGHKN
jgi:hypothetical protein